MKHRVFHRLPVELPVRYRIGGDAGPWAAGHTVNLSGGGMLLAVSGLCAIDLRDLVEGRRSLEVDFQLGGDRPVRVQCGCRVVWSQDLARDLQPCKLGLKFRELAEERRQQILDFVLAQTQPVAVPTAAGRGADPATSPAPRR